MKNLFTVLIISILLCLAGCGQNPTDSTPDGTPSSTPEDNLNTGAAESNVEDNTSIDPGYPTIFDFAVLPEDDFPRGMWTVNQLISKYGEPKSVTSDPYFIITATFDNVQFMLKSVYGYGAEELNMFSFYNEVKKAVLEKESNDDEYFESLKFDLNEADKNLDLRVLNLLISDKTKEFPYGIRIGKSTKSQIVSFYPVDSGEYNYENEIRYIYGFRDEDGNLPDIMKTTYGGMSYLFDENEMLQEVSIRWLWFSV